MKKLNIYVETSVWGMLVNDEPEVWREAADNFFANAGDYELYVSPIVFEEINNAYEMLNLYKEAIQSNQGVTVKNGKFIGPPMYLTANKIIRKVELIKQKESL